MGRRREGSASEVDVRQCGQTDAAASASRRSPGRAWRASRRRQHEDRRGHRALADRRRLWHGARDLREEPCGIAEKPVNRPRGAVLRRMLLREARGSWVQQPVRRHRGRRPLDSGGAGREARIQLRVCAADQGRAQWRQRHPRMRRARVRHPGAQKVAEALRRARRRGARGGAGGPGRRRAHAARQGDPDACCTTPACARATWPRCGSTR